MRNIGNKIPLVLLHLIQLTGHIIQCCRQVSHLISGIQLNVVFQISRRIFVCPFRNLLQGNGYGFAEYQQNNQGQYKNKSRRNINYIKTFIAGLPDSGNRHVNQHISIGIIISCNRRGNCHHIIGKQSIIITDRILAVSCCRWIKSGNLCSCPG